MATKEASTPEFIDEVAVRETSLGDKDAKTLWLATRRAVALPRDVFTFASVCS
jgi:hypothetical protein